MEGSPFLSLMQLLLLGVLVSRPWVRGPGKQLHDSVLLAGWVARYILELGMALGANLGDCLLIFSLTSLPRCNQAMAKWDSPLPGSGKVQEGWALGNRALLIVLVSWRLLSQITTNSVVSNNPKLYSLTVLGARSLKSRCQQGHIASKASPRRILLCLFQLLEEWLPWHSWASGCISPISATVFTEPSLLCTSVSKFPLLLS